MCSQKHQSTLINCLLSPVEILTGWHKQSQHQTYKESIYSINMWLDFRILYISHCNLINCQGKYSTCMKFTQEMHKSIAFRTPSSTCRVSHKYVSSWTSETVSWVLKKGWETRAEQWRLDFKMKFDHIKVQTQDYRAICWLLSG